MNQAYLCAHTHTQMCKSLQKSVMQERYPTWDQTSVQNIHHKYEQILLELDFAWLSMQHTPLSHIAYSDAADWTEILIMSKHAEPHNKHSTMTQN